MPRRRYYRRYTRVVAPKKKWATNMKSGELIVSVTGATSGHAESVLVSNSTQNTTPTPVIVKTGNFKIQGDCYLPSTQGVPAGFYVTLYVVYLPEVVVAQADPITAIEDHPEWIMGWKVINADYGSTVTNSNSASFSFSTRLKRNLNSGDTVSIVAVAENGSQFTQTVRVRYVAQYWTCAN